uniref:NAD(P)/FAD-dependent oxidoreductase n=1 Tax=Fervidicoccus fontis TaxID=683846 RepID=A0A7J3ZIV1_9CREN
MTDEHCNEKIAVVGAGVFGLLAARYFLNSDCNVVVYEEHATIGLPKHCTGIVSKETIEFIGDAARRCVVKAFERIVVEHELGARLILEGKPLAVLVDRVCLERELAREVERLGGQIELESRVEELDPMGRITIAGTTRSYDRVVLAFGGSSNLSRRLWYKSPRGIRGVNFLVRVHDYGFREGEIHTVLDKSVAPGFFYWIVPLNKREAIVGYGSENWSESPQSALSKICRTWGIDSYEVLEVYGGKILTGPPAGRLVNGRLIVTGDAAGLTKPVTGGGVYVAAITSRKPFASNCSSALHAYKRRLEGVRRRLARQHAISRIIHDSQMHYVVGSVLREIASSLEGRPLHVERFDEHDEIVKGLARNPLVLSRVLRSVLRAGDPRSIALLVYSSLRFLLA